MNFLYWVIFFMKFLKVRFPSFQSRGNKAVSQRKRYRHHTVEVVWSWKQEILSRSFHVRSGKLFYPCSGKNSDKQPMEMSFPCGHFCPSAQYCKTFLRGVGGVEKYQESKFSPKNAPKLFKSGFVCLFCLKCLFWWVN